MNPAKWPAPLLAGFILLVIVACIAARWLPTEPAWRVLGQVVASAVDIAT